MAQTTPSFTWVNGADTCNQQGIYGVPGVSSAANIPGARENSMSWSENNHLWLFGGHGYATTNMQGYLNDLWKYSISTGEWTWVSGADTTGQGGVYGALQVPATANHPCARQNGYTWTDTAGNLWLFGGIGNGSAYYNDLWKFDINLGEWAWMGGTNSINAAGVYGIQGTPATTNYPGARYGGVTWFYNNELWLFGGQGFITNQVRYNDLWKYNLTTNEWTWVSGSNMPDQQGNYGTLGIANATNVPGARQASVAWVDGQHRYWIFGGYGFPAAGSHGYLNDLWKYDPALNEWTWMKGSNTTAQPAANGTLGIASATNTPGARQMSISWTDPGGLLYMFGAWGHIGPPFGRINDLWKYNINTNEWTWIAGPDTTNQPGIYGIQGTSSVTNIPGARRMSISWKDNNNQCWLFGGNGYDRWGNLGLLNDVWKMDVGITTGLGEDLPNTLQIYPNPTTNELIISTTSPQINESIEIYSLQGELVLSIPWCAPAKIDLTNLQNGIYFLRIQSTPGNAYKIIKQ
jgi:N-acetylneuraminic acid mutarotase